MNPLEKLKQKLMAKPTINEIQPVVVAIQGETKANATKIKGTQVEKQGEKEEGEISEELAEPEPEIATKMVVIDETNKDYNRNEILMKLAENKKTRVKVKPLMEAVEASKQIEPIPTPAPQIQEQPPAKKARKMANKPLIIEGDEEIENV